MAGIHSNPSKSLQECGDGNLKNVLTAHIIVSNVGGQALTWMQPTEPTDLAAMWGIGLEAACLTLECTTQRGLRTVLHHYLRRRFQTNDRQLQYRRFRHDVFGDTLRAGTKSKRGNKYTEVFVTKFGWFHVFPTNKKGHAHEALYRLIQRNHQMTDCLRSPRPN